MNKSGPDTTNEATPTNGIVETLLGPMYSGKTSTMYTIVEKYSYKRGKKCIIIKYIFDTRYNHLAESGGLVTHRGHEMNRVEIVETKLLADIDEKISDYDVIGVDEAQFYPDGPEYVAKWAREGKHVICAALYETAQKDSDGIPVPFPTMIKLVAVSTYVTKLTAICFQCDNIALFSKKIIPDDKVEDIGGSEKYIAVCRACF